MYEDFYYRKTGTKMYAECKTCVGEINLFKKKQKSETEQVYFNIDKESKFYQYQKTWE